MLAGTPAARSAASQGYSITISAPLLHDPAFDAIADGGVKKTAGTGILILTGTNTYMVLHTY